MDSGVSRSSFRRPATTIGRYLLFGEIAAGGMATVHLGRLSGPAGFARTVAIKRLHPQFAKNPEFMSMFLDEARLAARIRHPNVVPTLDIVDDDGEIYLVMEFIQGASLSHLLRTAAAEGAQTDPWLVATLLSGVLHGLHAAHEATTEQGTPLEIVHRDVSPQNILVGIDGVPRVVDFGVAKAVGRLQITREGQIKGKWSYMAPEQIAGRELTRRADIYSAAVVAWEALTGCRLFKAENEAAIVRAVLRDRIPPPSEVAPDLPRELDAIIMRGLDRNASKRYATAREMALELERCGGIVPASDVGAWVDSLVHAEIEESKARIAELHRISQGSIALPPAARTSAPTRVDATQVRSDVSSIAVAPSRPPPPAPASRFAFGAGFFAAGTLVGLTALLLLSRGRGPDHAGASSDATAIAPTRTAPSSTPSRAESHSAPSPSIRSIEATDLPIASPPALPVSALPAAPLLPPAFLRRHGIPAASTNPPATPPAPAGSCDPPTWIDEDGHTRYKPACL